MFLQVNLKYPTELHSSHSDLPMAPERYTMCYNELGPLNKFLYKQMKNKKIIFLLKKN